MIKLAKTRNIYKIKKVLSMILVFSFIFIGLYPVLQEEMQKAEKIRENLLILPLTAEVHSKILIDGDAELAAFCAGNGTDGSSWDAAHVIKDYEIDAEASSNGIEIRDTTLFVIIQNCIVTNAGVGGGAGIYLTNCTNVKITECNSSFNSLYGFSLSESHDCIITGNNASNNEYGILFSDCYNNIISGNNVSYNPNIGILLDTNCDNNTISGNNVSDSNFGLYLYESSNNKLSGNNASFNDYGIVLDTNCDNNTISRNNASYNINQGIYIDQDSNNNTISGNNAWNNTDSGFLIKGSNKNTLSGNNAWNNTRYGFIFDGSENNTLSGNNISYNKYGIYIMESYYNNSIWMNYISNNSISQGWSDSPSNWDNGTLGNYWGDFVERYPDATSSNGIWWDWEYQVDATIYNDTKPLVHLGFPEIDSSLNVDYMIGDEGNEISWTISDSTILDPTYWIYLDGVEIQTDSWGSESIISFDVDGLSVGTYNYKLICNDGTAWGWSESQIAVNVAEVPKPVITTTSQTINTKNITVEWSEVVGVDSYNVYINGTLTYSTDNLTQNIWLNETGTYLITVTAINGAEESEHSNAVVIIVDIKSNVGIIIGSIGGSLVVVGVGAFLFIKKRRTPT